MSGACGSCTLCCTVIKVEFPGLPDKPAGTRCGLLCGQGCSIYPDRPEGCRVFKCFWLGSQERQGREKMPSHLRPDRTGIVLEVNTKGNLVANCETPSAWRREPMHSLMRRWVREGTTVMIKAGGEASLLRADGELEPLVHIGVDPDTNENLYSRTPYHGVLKERHDGRSRPDQADRRPRAPH